ncbi:MAG: Coenzyme F420 hydrogenase/dehydrogenase, beta subunit C-terminal domain [Syntrophales bacterium]|jgi:coenzyme F420 hydrogenase subunit beta|nr:Coenzyme F420 hydrogenase/dehydrogenase, beta subunit C-terminal domain [Syntrophales bacterium]
MEKKVLKRGPEELQKYVLEAHLCTGCGACMNLCPYFRSYRGKTTALFTCAIDEGKCFAYCPKIGVDFDGLSQRFFGKPYDGSPLGPYQTITAAYAGDRLKGIASQAGGTVSALIYFALEKGYIDGAVLTERKGLLPVPRFVTAPEDALACSTSKYTAAPTLSMVNQALRNGYKNIGLVGTPCQVLATALMRSNPFNIENFVDSFGLVVGLFCTWAIDYRLFEPFLAEQTEISRIRKIDIPPPPSEIMEVFVNNGNKLEIPLNEIRKLVPNGCSYCIDMTSEFSDLSVGVMEGRPDMNTLLVRTERGRKVVEEAEKEGYLILAEIPEENLEHLTWAAGNKKRRGLAKAQSEGMINTKGDVKAYMRMNPQVLERLAAQATGGCDVLSD